MRLEVPVPHQKIRNPATGRMRCWAGCPACVIAKGIRRRSRRRKERDRGGPCHCRAYRFPHRIGSGKCYRAQPHEQMLRDIAREGVERGVQQRLEFYRSWDFGYPDATPILHVQNVISMEPSEVDIL